VLNFRLWIWTRRNLDIRFTPNFPSPRFNQLSNESLHLKSPGISVEGHVIQTPGIVFGLSGVIEGQEPLDEYVGGEEDVYPAVRRVVLLGT
jgi:hypothetical protein